MKTRIITHTAVFNQPDAAHVLFVLPALGHAVPVPRKAVLDARLVRRGMKPVELAKAPLVADLPEGGLAAWVVVDPARPAFERHTLLRKGMQALLGEAPKVIHVVLCGSESARRALARDAAYVALVNGTPLPTGKSGETPRPLARVELHHVPAGVNFRREEAVAEGNWLARELTVQPPNRLTPGHYRERVRALAKAHGWKLEEYDFRKLRKMGAGAFCAVAQGSGEDDAAIVRLTRRPKGAKGSVALVGKGICFDTGGHNLKPAKYMQGMHEDMNGSAVALGILLAATCLDLPVGLEVWLAIARNHLSPEAYRPGDVVTAVNGTTIEVVHTDAEGRMVLADTLALAAKEKPAAIVDFATLTGSMAVALGDRYSGVLANREGLAEAAVRAARAVGERVCAFPLDADYDEALESKVADVKQCTLDSDADHILAARFLGRFVKDTPWLHVDLSSSRREGGLGAAASDVTGFGVGLGLALLEDEAVKKA